MSKNKDNTFDELLKDVSKYAAEYARREKALDKFTEELETFNTAIKQKVNSLASLVDDKKSEVNKVLFEQNLPFMQVALPYLQEVASYYELRISHRKAVNEMNEEIMDKIRHFNDEIPQEFILDCRRSIDDWMDDINFQAIRINEQMNLLFDDQKIVAEAYNALL